MMQMTLNGIALEIQRKNIKNLYIRVLPDGTVKVSVPFSMSDEQLHNLLNKKANWIKTQLQTNRSKERPAAMQYITGEQFKLWGKNCTLVVQNSSVHHSITKIEQCIYMQTTKYASAEHKEHMLIEWSRQQIKNEIPALLEKWQPVIGVSIKQWGIKNMKTRWGTCNTSAQRIWLNLQLIHYPPTCLEFVVVHELTHLLERSHNKRFYALMDSFLPNWRLADQLLKS